MGGFSFRLSRLRERVGLLTSLAVLMQASPSASLRSSGLVTLIRSSSWFCRRCAGGLTLGERSGSTRWGGGSRWWSSTFALLRPWVDGRLMRGELRLDQIDLFRHADRPRTPSRERVSE